jgi:hypothetical protein
MVPTIETVTVLAGGGLVEPGFVGVESPSSLLQLETATAADRTATRMNGKRMLFSPPEVGIRCAEQQTRYQQELPENQHESYT